MAIRKIDLMHRQFGICEGRTCRECNNLTHVKANDRPRIKCKVYGVTSSAASDWAQRWQACGMFNKQWDKEEVIKQVRPIRTDREETQRIPIPGQISVEDLL